jgi:hypothetical protein
LSSAILYPSGSLLPFTGYLGAKCAQNGKNGKPPFANVS